MKREQEFKEFIGVLARFIFVAFILFFLMDLLITFAAYLKDQSLFFELEFNKGIKDLFLGKITLHALLVILIRVPPFFLISVSEKYLNEGKLKRLFIFLIFYTLFVGVAHLYGFISWLPFFFDLSDLPAVLSR